MDQMNEVRLRMRVSKLEARLALLEIEAAALSREIASSLTPKGAERKRKNVGTPLWLEEAPSGPNWRICANRTPASPAIEWLASTAPPMKDHRYATPL